jgi:hypothetical protein
MTPRQILDAIDRALDDRRVRRLHASASNGRPSRSIGQPNQWGK